MPRLLNRLIQRIKRSTDERVHKHKLPRNSIGRTIPIAIPPPNFYTRGRRHSILLDDIDPITNRDAFIHHKSSAPIVPSVGRGGHADTISHVREMTDHECQLWSDPYLRMLGSPLRQCLVTQKYLPMDFMLRLAVLQIKGPRHSQPILALLPDGVEHPRFRGRNSGRGYYLTSHKTFVAEMSSRLSYKRIPVAKVQVHSLLAQQITHQLRLRILQEIELMTESLRCTPQTSLEVTIIRRLTRTEWAEIKSSGRISQRGAIAIMVVPPLNDRTHMQSKKTPPFNSLPPVSVLHRTHDNICLNPLLSTSQVPLYNGLALFPCTSMRSKLYKALQKALSIEWKARWRQNLSSRCEKKVSPQVLSEKSTKDKASHAYLLRSDSNTARRADSVPLAVALWRLRMWEGLGWDDGEGNWAG